MFALNPHTVASVIHIHSQQKRDIYVLAFVFTRSRSFCRALSDNTTHALVHNRSHHGRHMCVYLLALSLALPPISLALATELAETCRKSINERNKLAFDSEQAADMKTVAVARTRGSAGAPPTVRFPVPLIGPSRRSMYVRAHVARRRRRR